MYGNQGGVKWKEETSQRNVLVGSPAEKHKLTDILKYLGFIAQRLQIGEIKLSRIIRCSYVNRLTAAVAR